MKNAFQQWGLWFQNVQQKQVCFQLTWDSWKVFKQIRKQSCPAKVLVFIFLRTDLWNHYSDHDFGGIIDHWSNQDLGRIFEIFDLTKIMQRFFPDHWSDKDLEQITVLIIILDGSSRWLTRPRCWTELRDHWFDQDLWRSLRSMMRTWSDQDLELICDAIDLREILDRWWRSLIWSRSRTDLRYH